MSVDHVDRALRSLAAEVDWPPAEDVSARVAAAIRSERRAVQGWRIRWQPALVAAGTVLVLTAAVLVASPGARSAVASWLGLGGVRVERQEDSRGPATGELNLGDLTSRRAAGDAVDFTIRGVELDDPRVFLDRSVPGGMVSLVYPPQPRAPAAATPAVGAILSQFRGDGSDPLFTKEVLQGEDVQFVSRREGLFMWVSGPSHLLLRNEDGEPLRHTARLSANALVWTAPDGVAYRLETAVDLEDAITLAATLR